MKNATELSPCPFCGCAATYVKHSAGMPGTQGFDKWDAVACKHCRATVGACDRRFRCREDAAEAWNRRLPLSAPPAPGRAPLTDEQIAVLQFLYGLGNLDGCGFGDRPHGERGMYWWRKHLRAAFPGIAPAGGIGGE